jgi:Flp pilus assembly protein TadG
MTGRSVRTPARPRHHERGASAVEFALLVPLLVMLVFGVINFGIVLAQKQSLSSAARAGARLGSVNLYEADSHNCGKVIDQTRAEAQTIAMAGTSVTVEVLRGSSLATATRVCSTDSSLTPNSTSAAPCANGSLAAGATENLYVRATRPDTEIGIPATPIAATFDLSSTGAFQCEYH